MLRTYKKIPGKRQRNVVNFVQLEKAIEVVKNGMSRRMAAKEFNIDRTVLQRRIKDNSINLHPGPVSALSPELEQTFANRLSLCADWGYPFELQEIQTLIANYLQLNGIKIPKFKNNVPGINYVKGFIKRHPELSHRFARNIKRSRAAVDYDCLKSFFDNISSELENVPPENIFNYDETNFTDDPGIKKFVCRRIAKYVERVMNSTKSSTSVMFAVNAVGFLLPPYIVYKAKHLYNTWISGGPTGTRYNRSQSGWFDKDSFIDWLETIVIPHLRRLEGGKNIFFIHFDEEKFFNLFVF